MSTACAIPAPIRLHSALPFTPTPAWKDLSDEDLIAAHRLGDSPASLDDLASELFERHQARVIRWCCRFMHDREAALDLTQEILLRAYRSLDHYRGECRFSTWLYVIARNLCMTALQKRASEPAWVGKAVAMDLPDSRAVDIHMRVEHEQSRSLRWNLILNTLDRTEAQVMLLHYGEEMPLRAVSRVLGLTNKSGAKAYIVSARRKLSAVVG
jgi:RNA polymerase sigma-70 factor (ECF subfamily)